MNNHKHYVLPDGRACYPFPWETKAMSPPWKAKYERVLIPLTERERLGSSKKAHVQIVKRSKIREIKEARLSLR